MDVKPRNQQVYHHELSVGNEQVKSRQEGVMVCDVAEILGHFAQAVPVLIMAGDPGGI
jgi:hypothetical protein